MPPLSFNPKASARSLMRGLILSPGLVSACAQQVYTLTTTFIDIKQYHLIYMYMLYEESKIITLECASRSH